MDRREALQKMMAGGAVVVGASMVSSSPVFAAGSLGGGQPIGPGLVTPPPNTHVVNDKRNATWTVAAPNVQCSGSEQLQIASYALPPRTISGNVSVVIVAPSGWGDPYIPDADTITFTAVGTGPGNSPFRRGDSFEVVWSVRYRCMVGDEIVGCQIVDYTYRYVNQANGNPNWQQVPVSPIQRDCPL
jgi:hypothetical protein